MLRGIKLNLSAALVIGLKSSADDAAAEVEAVASGNLVPVHNPRKQILRPVVSKALAEARVPGNRDWRNHILSVKKRKGVHCSGPRRHGVIAGGGVAVVQALQSEARGDQERRAEQVRLADCGVGESVVVDCRKRGEAGGGGRIVRIGVAREEIVASTELMVHARIPLV